MLEDMYADSDIPKEDWEKDFMKNHRSRSQIQRLIRPEKLVVLLLWPAQILLLSRRSLKNRWRLSSTIF